MRNIPQQLGLTEKKKGPRGITKAGMMWESGTRWMNQTEPMQNMRKGSEKVEMENKRPNSKRMDISNQPKKVPNVVKE